jgi:hypothetical protein
MNNKEKKRRIARNSESLVQKFESVPSCTAHTESR